MQVDINTGAFFIGLALIVIGIIGGGIEIKEVKIPTLPMFPRAVLSWALRWSCFVSRPNSFRPQRRRRRQ
jgi:hypothetical protein